ncbi:MAG: ORF6N domain-containing protein [Clostridiales bacterium]|nr:ORF6N domain-containing protein [Clostridiales bacterium]
MIVDESSLKDKIYTIRGHQVMLDFDLAEIYGYTTKAFNQQVKNNIECFPDDFRFQLTRIEVEELSRSKILTSMQTAGIKGGRAYLPYVFTEQGIYMLMSVLKGDLATSQSITLIRLFKSMKDYLIENQPFLTQKTLVSDDGSGEDYEEVRRKEKELYRKAFADLAYIFDELSW